MLPEIAMPEAPSIDPRTGAPKTILLLHGLFGRVTNWESTWRYYSPRYRVGALDFDLYNPKAQFHNIDSLTKLTLKFMDRHQIESAAVFGNSLGGHVALKLALEHPDRVVALVLCGSAGLVERGYSQVPSAPTVEYAKQRISEVFYDQKFATEELFMEVYTVIQSTRNKLRIIKLARSSRNMNMLDHLPEIATPTLLVWGNQDGITPPEVGRTFAEKMPNAQICFIDECGHAPNIEKPDELNVAADRFLHDLGY